jgi:hypothetical protein
VQANKARVMKVVSGKDAGYDDSEDKQQGSFYQQQGWHWHHQCNNSGEASAPKAMTLVSATRTYTTAQQGQRRQHKDGKDASAIKAKTPAKQ